MTALRHIPQFGRQLGVRVWYVPLAVLLFAASFLPAFRSNGTEIGALPTRPFDALAVVAIALQCFPLAARRRWPVSCLALVAAGFSSTNCAATTRSRAPRSPSPW